MENCAWTTKYEVEMPVKRCYEFEWAKEREEFFKINLVNWNCLDFKNFTMGGFWDGNFVKSIFLHTELCVNRTDSDVICASEEEMKVEFANVVTGGNLFYSFLYLERQPKMTNYEEPLQNYMVNTYDMMDMKVNKRRISKIKKTYINDDKGWIFPSASEDFVYSLDTFEKDFIMRQEKDSIIYQHHIYTSNSRILIIESTPKSKR